MTAGNHALCTATKVTGAVLLQPLGDQQCARSVQLLKPTKSAGTQKLPTCQHKHSVRSRSSQLLSTTVQRGTTQLHRQSCRLQQFGLCKNLLQNLARLKTQRKNLGNRQIKPVTHMFPLSAVQQMHSVTRRC